MYCATARSWSEEERKYTDVLYQRTACNPRQHSILRWPLRSIFALFPEQLLKGLISHRRSVAALCYIRSGVTWCTIFMVHYLCRMCYWGLYHKLYSNYCRNTLCISRLSAECTSIIQHLLSVATEKLSEAEKIVNLPWGLFTRSTISFSVFTRSMINVSVIYYKYTWFYLIF